MSSENKSVDVLWEDQQKINQFGKLNIRRIDLVGLIQEAKDTLEKLEDASTDLELADEGDSNESWLKVGEIFVDIDSEEILERIEDLTSQTQSSLSVSQKSLDATLTEMEELKRILYAKFGDNINLEVGSA